MTSPSTSISFGIRVIGSIGLAVFWTIGYFFKPHTVAGPVVATFNPSIPLDGLIPFMPWAIWLYLAGIVLIALPLLLLRSSASFRRTVIGYALIMAISFIVFLVLPAEAHGLRDQATNGISATDRLTAWAIRTLHEIDLPTNLFPSLHVSLATAATVMLVRQYPAWRYTAGVCLAVVIASVFLVKQHTIADAVAGFALAICYLHVSDAFAGRSERRARLRLLNQTSF